MCIRDRFDRGSKTIQAVAELISLRNSYVHSKVHAMKEGKWTTLGICKASDKWSADDAEKVFRLLIAFLEDFVVQLCKFRTDEIDCMLRSYTTTNEGISILLVGASDRKTMLKLSTFLDRDLSFLGIENDFLNEKGVRKSFTIDLSDEQVREIKRRQEVSRESPQSHNAKPN